MVKRRRALKHKIFHNKEFTRLDGIPVVAYYRFDKDKHLDLLKRDKYIMHVIFPNPLNVAQFRYLFDAEELIVNELKAAYPEINKDNSFIYYVIDLPKGMHFIIDVRMFDYIFERKKKIESEKNIKLAHNIALFSPTDKKTMKMASFVSQVFAPEHEAHIVTSIEEVNRLISKIDSQPGYF